MCHLTILIYSFEIEAQRIKLASFLLKSGCKEKTLFIFDEPTTISFQILKTYKII